MLRFLIACLAVACTISVARAQDVAPQPDKLACDGPFAKDTTHAKLVAAFGAKNVTYEDVDAAEGNKEKATVLFANEPTRRVEIVWLDAARRARPGAITVRSPSQWVGPEGITIGMRLEQIEKLNGKPFGINGFEWDGGGFAGTFDGKLKTLPGGCRVSLRFDATRTLKMPKFAPIVGDKLIPSTNSLMRQVRPMISEWSVRYGE